MAVINLLRSSLEEEVPIANTIANVATVEFRFGAFVVIKKSVFNVAYQCGIAGSHFGIHGQATRSARRSSVSELGSPTARKSKEIFEG